VLGIALRDANGQAVLTLALDARSHGLTVSYDGDFQAGLSDLVALPVLWVVRILTTGGTPEMAPDSSPSRPLPPPYRPPAHELGHQGPPRRRLVPRQALILG